MSAILEARNGISRQIAKQDSNKVKAYSITQQHGKLSVIVIPRNIWQLHGKLALSGLLFLYLCTAYENE